MTTPNNQPTPPPGMEILTDYTQALPEGAVFYSKRLNGWADIWPTEIGLPPLKSWIYAIPITVPATGDKTLIQTYVEKHGTLTPRDIPTATGDTTNEKGGEQRPDIEARNRIASISVEDDPMADNLAIALASYFSSHPGRPEDDSEHDDNYHWGDWVLEKTNAALDLIVKYTRK